jgi:hypothetical protein
MQRGYSGKGRWSARRAHELPRRWDGEARARPIIIRDVCDTLNVCRKVLAGSIDSVMLLLLLASVAPT